MHQKKNIKFSKGNTNFVWGSIIMLIIVTYSWKTIVWKEIYRFKASNENNNFPSQFVVKVYVINLTVLIKKKYLLNEMYIIFQWTMMLLINLINLTL